MIPRTIHHIWLGSPIPTELERRRQTWAANNPGWTLKLWTDDNIKTKYSYLAGLCEFHAQRADIYRYEILHREGGIYVDVDFEATRGIEPLVRNLNAFSVVEHWRPGGNQLSVGLIGAAPRQPIFEDMLSMIFQRLDPQKFTSLGPDLFTEVARRHPELTVFTKQVFYPFPEQKPKAIAFHHPRSGRWIGDDSYFVDQTAPATMVPGAVYSVRVVFRNNGAHDWMEEEKVRLGSQSPEDGRTWGRSRMLMPFGDPVRTGQTRGFVFEVTAPKQPGRYVFQWKLLREGVSWFGQQSAPVEILVG